MAVELTNRERIEAINYIIENASGFDGMTKDEITGYLVKKGDGFITTLAGGLQKDFYFGPNSKI